MMNPMGRGTKTVTTGDDGVFSLSGFGDGDLTIGQQAHYIAHQEAVKGALSVHENLAFWRDFLGGGDVDEALDAFDLSRLSRYASRKTRPLLDVLRELEGNEDLVSVEGPSRVAAKAFVADLPRGDGAQSQRNNQADGEQQSLAVAAHQHHQFSRRDQRTVGRRFGCCSRHRNRGDGGKDRHRQAYLASGLRTEKVKGVGCKRVGCDIPCDGRDCHLSLLATDVDVLRSVFAAEAELPIQRRT